MDLERQGDAGTWRFQFRKKFGGRSEEHLLNGNET